jgi:hypothetical protein
MSNQQIQDETVRALHEPKFYVTEEAINSQMVSLTDILHYKLIP